MDNNKKAKELLQKKRAELYYPHEDSGCEYVNCQTIDLIDQTLALLQANETSTVSIVGAVGKAIELLKKAQTDLRKYVCTNEEPNAYNAEQHINQALTALQAEPQENLCETSSKIRGT